MEAGDDALTIHGERKQEHEDERDGMFWTERSYGSFTRVIPLPAGTISDSAKASFTNGVLEVVMQAPSTETRRGRRIDISGAPHEGGEKNNYRVAAAPAGQTPRSLGGRAWRGFRRWGCGGTSAGCDSGPAAPFPAGCLPGAARRRGTRPWLRGLEQTTIRRGEMAFGSQPRRNTSLDFKAANRSPHGSPM